MNNYNQYNSGEKLFYNKVIRNEIYKWNRCLSKVNDWRIYEFKSIESYELEKDNHFIKSIIMVNCFKDSISSSLVQFLNQLPSNIESVEFKQASKVQIDIKTISIPSTLKTIKFDNNIALIDEDSHKKGQDTISDLSSLSYQLNGLRTMHLGFLAEEVMMARYLPFTLKHLTVSGIFRDPITKSNLPDTLESLIILSEYEHSTLEFPRYLKHFSYGKGYPLLLSVIKQLPESLEVLRLDAKFQFGYGYDSSKLDFLNRLVNLKNLSISNSIYTYLFYGLFIRRPLVFPNLINLEIIRKGFFSIGDFDIDSLPSTLFKVKLPNSFFKSKSGYPASLTSIETSLSGFRKEFQNASNIKTVSIMLKDEKNLSNNFIDWDQFINLTSLKYQQLETTSLMLLPPSHIRISNLELSCSNSFESQPSFQLNQLNHLKSLKLDATFSRLQFGAHTILGEPVSTFYPESLKLLEITSHSPLTITGHNIPSSIQLLIIRGSVLPHFVFPLPETLETIYISNQINYKPIIKSLIQFNITIQLYYYENDRKYYSNSTYSKLYNNIKNKLIN